MKRYKLASLIDEITEEAKQALSVKEDADLSEKNAMPNISSNIGQVLRKLASQLREQSHGVTYDDIEKKLAEHNGPRTA